MPNRYLKQNKPCFTYNHDNNVDLLSLFNMFIGHWRIKKIRFLWKKKIEKKCQIYKEEKSGI